MFYLNLNQLINNEYFSVFIRAVITTVGAFVPLFCVMYLHFKIRKSFYLNMLPYSINALDGYNKIKDTIEKSLLQVYQKYNAKDQIELIDKLQGSSNEVRDGIFSVVSDWERQKMQIDMDIMKEENTLSHLKNYTFREYLSALLNQKFPDAYLNNKN